MGWPALGPLVATRSPRSLAHGVQHIPWSPNNLAVSGARPAPPAASNRPKPVSSIIAIPGLAANDFASPG